MKILVLSALLVLAPAWSMAQQAAQPAGKTVAKSAAKSTAAKPAQTAKAKAKPQAAVVAKAAPTSSRTRLHSGAMQVAAGISAAEAALTPEELAIADEVHTGRMACELGAFVQV